MSKSTKEIELEEKNRLYELVTKNSTDLVAMCDSDFNFTYASPSYKTVLGYDPQDLIGEPVYKLVPEEELAEIVPLMEQGKANKISKESVVHRLRHRNGELFWFETIGMTLFDENGEPAGAEFNIREVTDRKKAEDDLKESEERYRALVDSSQEGLFLHKDGIIVEVNAAGAELFGYSVREMIGRNVFEFCAEEDREQLAVAIQTKAKEAFEARSLRKDGTQRWMRVRARTTVYKGEEVRATGILDVHEQKQALQALKESEDRYRAVFQSHNLVFVTDLERNLVDANQAALDLMGYDREDIANLRFDDILHPEQDMEPLLREFDVMMRTGTQKEKVEVKLITRDKKVKYVESKGALVHEKNLLVSVANDITSQKIAEEALRQSEAKYRELANNSPIGIYEADLVHGRYTNFNDPMCELTGYSREELFALNPFETLTKESQQLYLERFRKTKEGENVPEFVEYQIEKKDGTVIDVALSGRITTRDGRITSANGVVQDITERKIAEKEIRRSQRYLENVIDSSPSAMMCLDLELNITQWNRSAEKLTGSSKEAAIGSYIFDIFTQYREFSDDIVDVIQTRIEKKVEKLKRIINDRNRYFDIIMYPLVANGCQGVVVTFDDVTERVRLEETMIQTEKMMSLGGLSAGMAHEINNPLAAIVQNAQNITRRLQPDPEKHRSLFRKNREVAAECDLDLDKMMAYLNDRQIVQAVGAIKSAGDRAAVIVRNMLEFGRTSSSEIKPEFLHDLLNETVKLARQDYDLKKKYDFKHIGLIRDYDPQLAQIPCSKTEIEQVVLNLLKNSAEAMKEIQDVSYRPQITLRTRLEENHVRIEIADNGPGMDENVQKKVFEPFFTTKEVGAGTGLGLSVSYFIVKNHHQGEISVESAPGKGTTFTIQLPTDTGDSSQFQS
ncbi:MAG: PAS domain S-box protein [Proteobacteria bacterium]|nr:PAS domain S-box protein [Pseudomonadota bacterium]